MKKADTLDLSVMDDPVASEKRVGDIHKPRGQLRGLPK